MTTDTSTATGFPASATGATTPWIADPGIASATGTTPEPEEPEAAAQDTGPEPGPEPEPEAAAVAEPEAEPEPEPEPLAPAADAGAGDLVAIVESAVYAELRNRGYLHNEAVEECRRQLAAASAG